jgi:hypothetical protein
VIPVTIREYFGPHKCTESRHLFNAKALLAAVTPLLERARSDGVVFKMNPATGTLVSGTTFGGYRPQSCPIGAPQSAHKTGEAVDIYDPAGELDTWLDDEKLEKYGLYREHPEDTAGWCHLTTRSPKSGRRTFKP